MELLDEVQVKAINNANGKNLPEAPTLMFELIGTGESDISSLLLISDYLVLPYFRRIVTVAVSFFPPDNPEAYSREQTQIVQKIVSEHNGSDFVFAEDPEAKKELWKVRITMYSDILVLVLVACRCA